MQTVLLRHGDDRFLVQRGRLCAGPGEVLKEAMRHGDRKIFLVYRSARQVKGFATVETSTGPRRRLCTKHEITERFVVGRARQVGEDDDFVWVFDRDAVEVIGRV